jgi:steroid delta-isomerase-like uncharacterized protein
MRGFFFYIMYNYPNLITFCKFQKLKLIKMNKNISIIMLVSLISYGCNNIPENYIDLENDKITLSENSKTYEEVWTKFFNERDMDVLNNQYFTEDVTVVLPGDDLVGIEALKNFYGNYVNGFSDAEFTFVDLFGQGDKLVKHWNFKGTHDGDFFGIPATGKKVDLNGTTLILMENGKIKQEQDYFDNLDFYTQLGLMD